MSDATIAASIRRVVRSAYSGSSRGSSEIAVIRTLASGASVSRPPCATSTKPPNSKVKASASHRFGTKRERPTVSAG